MFEILKSVIETKLYKLTEIQHKIKKLYVMGDLTEEQADELLTMASGSVSTEAERPEILSMIKVLAEKITSLESRLNALESDTEEETEGTEQTYPEWKAWDGISTDYQKGAIVSHNGKLWISEFDGQNVWQPDTLGTEALWVLFEN